MNRKVLKSIRMDVTRLRSLPNREIVMVNVYGEVGSTKFTYESPTLTVHGDRLVDLLKFLDSENMVMSSQGHENWVQGKYWTKVDFHFEFSE